MGYAKYHEDDREIWENRMRGKKAPVRTTNISTPMQIKITQAKNNAALLKLVNNSMKI
jgi:hypothetical protein